MRGIRSRTLVATAGAAILPIAGLAYLATVLRPGSAGAILLQSAVVVVGLVLFALSLARLVEQFNAGRVARWLETPEGRGWLESLPDEEREAFEGRFDGFR